MYDPPAVVVKEIRLLIKWKIEDFDSIESTQDMARELARSGSPEGTVVRALHQSRGRGRENRHWFSPEDAGIWATCILRPDFSSDLIPLISIAIATAIVSALEEVTGREVLIKWPNDIYMGGKKLGGILCEAETDSALGISFVLVGFGINVLDPRGGFPAKLSGIATSLEAETENRYDQEGLLSSMLELFDSRLACLSQEGPERLIEEASHSDFLMGKYVFVKSGNREVQGTAAGFGKRGGILIENESGERSELISGEITAVRT